MKKHTTLAACLLMVAHTHASIPTAFRAFSRTLMQPHARLLHACTLLPKNNVDSLKDLSHALELLKEQRDKNTHSYLLEVADRRDAIHSLNLQIEKIERNYNQSHPQVQHHLMPLRHKRTTLMLQHVTRHAAYTKQNNQEEQAILNLQEKYTTLLTSNPTTNKTK